MKRKILLVIMLLSASATTYAQKFLPDQIVGTWQCEDYKIQIFKSLNTYAARLLWAKDIYESDGKTPRRDEKNPDEKLRSRSRQGIIHITDLAYKDGEYINGKLYSVQDGNTYSLKATLKGIDDLQSRGYKGIPMIGKTFFWKRVQ